MQTATLAAPSEPFDLPPFHAQVRRQAEELAAGFADRHREIRLHPFEHGELYPALWRAISDRGWPGLLLPSVHGGSEGGLLAYALVMEALAACNLVLWMPVLGASIGHAIAEVGPDTARERWLAPISRGQAFLALAVTEPQCGHNVFRSRTTVRRSGERFVIDGLKAVTSGIDLAERVLVFGRSADGQGTPPRSSPPCSSIRRRPGSNAASCRCAGARAYASSSSRSTRWRRRSRNSSDPRARAC